VSSWVQRADGDERAGQRVRRAAWRSTGESYGKVGINARLLDGYAERDGESLFDGERIEIRYIDNAD
jgi:hypothetical protein